jgi:RNA polymerase sigma-70 factor (ECF subfamily)
MAENLPLHARLRASDPAALAEFLTDHRPQLLAYVDRNLGQRLRAKVEPADLVQETAVAALSALPAADLADQDPFGWLCQIAHQRIADAGRRFNAGKRKSALEVALAAQAGDSSANWISVLSASITSPSSAAVRNERTAAVAAVVATLPPGVREILRLRYVDDLSTKEIAGRLGKTDGAVRVTLSRTVQKLIQTLAADETRLADGKKP